MSKKIKTEDEMSVKKQKRKIEDDVRGKIK